MHTESRADVLLVDDLKANLAAMQTVLQPLGCTLHTAESGQEALKRVMHHDFAVILLDVMMPGMDGFETATLIRGSDRSRPTPIIFVTAHDLDRESMLTGYEMGAVDFIFKPVENQVLLSKVSVFVELKMFRDHLERLVDERTKKLAATVRNLERSNRELEQFAYVASHDLQEPLRMVTSFTQLLADRYKGKLDAKADSYIEFAVDGAVRMKSLIDNLLTYSRVGSQATLPRPVDSSEVVEETLKALSKVIEERRADLRVSRLPRVLADPVKLGQVFQNLIENALKFCGDRTPVIEILAERNGREWVFEIKDNGVGIAPEHSERIFAIFERLGARETAPGNGIGLSVVKKILEQHGGRVWVESEPGVGSRFLFTLPDAQHREDEA